MSRVSEQQYRRNSDSEMFTADHENWNNPTTSTTRSRTDRVDRITEQANTLTSEIGNDMNDGNPTLSAIGEDDRQNPGNTFTDLRQDHDSYNLFPISSLPMGTLLHVFSFLKKNEQLRMSSVCKHWHQLIFSSACLWRKRHMTLRCSHQSRSSRKAFFYARLLGRYLHKLSVACEHPNNHACRTMAISFRRLMTGLKVPASLRSFKVTDLRLSHARASVLLDISSSLERFIYSLQHLKCFQMSNAYWPAQEGLRVMNSVLTSCQNSLDTLSIDGFFLSRFVPPRALDVLTPGLSGLTRLRKLSIDYLYLNDQTVLALAAARQGQLRSLKLVASDVSPNLQFVSRAAWLTLTRSCPFMRVEFVVQGFTVSPSVSLPMLLCPSLRVHKLSLYIGNNYTYLDTPRLNMATVLSHITRHFRRRLTRFELDVDNHNDRLDIALIRLVRKSRHLTSVKVKAFFTNPETDMTLRQILRERRDKHAARDNGRNAALTINVTDRDVTSTQRVTEADGRVITEEDGHVISGEDGLISSEEDGRVITEEHGCVITGEDGRIITEELGGIITGENGRISSEEDGRVITGEHGREEHGRLNTDAYGRVFNELTSEARSSNLPLVQADSLISGGIATSNIIVRSSNVILPEPRSDSGIHEHRGNGGTVTVANDEHTSSTISDAPIAQAAYVLRPRTTPQYNSEESRPSTSRAANTMQY